MKGQLPPSPKGPPGPKDPLAPKTPWPPQFLRPFTKRTTKKFVGIIRSARVSKTRCLSHMQELSENFKINLHIKIIVLFLLHQNFSSHRSIFETKHHCFWLQEEGKKAKWCTLLLCDQLLTQYKKLSPNALRSIY